jgi:hypothetical protein
MQRTRVQSPLNFLLNHVLIYYRRSQMSELCHIFETYYTEVHVFLHVPKLFLVAALLQYVYIYG